MENPGFLYYANGGSFIPSTVQKSLATHGPQRHCRNECLCNAMVNFNMIEIVGRGIRKIFNQQWERRFPMPDYEIDAAKKEVAVRLYGNAINEKYTKLLKENKDLSFEDCLLLDAVQKGHQLKQQLRFVGRILVEMYEEGTIRKNGLKWSDLQYSDRNPTVLGVIRPFWMSSDRNLMYVVMEKVINRSYRNRRIDDFLKELHITEGRSTGFPKIYRALKKNDSPLPQQYPPPTRTAHSMPPAEIIYYLMVSYFTLF